MEARYTIDVNGVDYIIQPGTFQEGAVRREVTLQEIGREDLQARPDNRGWWQTSWSGGSQWERPVYSLSNINTYHESSQVSLTDRGGAIQQGRARTEASSNLDLESTKLVQWSKNGISGAVALDWSGALSWYSWNGSAFVSDSANYTGPASTDKVMAASGGTDDRVWAIMDTGDLLSWDTSTTTVVRDAAVLTVYNGTNIWVDADKVWIYNGDQLYSYDITGASLDAVVVNDGYGVDAFSASATFGDGKVVPEWSCTRAINTSEGIFYVKNILDGGTVAAKVFRVDRDASGTYINTPIGTLPKGAVAIDMVHHLGSIVVSTVPNFMAAAANTADQRVTYYHVTGSSIGAIGSPLGSELVDETPVWFLTTRNEMLYIGGRKRVWEYDARVGALHELYVHTASDTAFLDYGGGYTTAATVALSSGYGLLFAHSGQAGAAAQPRLQTFNDAEWVVDSDTSWLSSNYIDFDMPMDQKVLTEVFYDGYFRPSETITIQGKVDDNTNWVTLATITGSGYETTRVTPSTLLKGYKFRYRVLFSAEGTAASTDDPSRLYSIGFNAQSGEYVNVLQFTINGNESVNIENNVQHPKDVYDNMDTLRATGDPISVTHYYVSDQGDESKTGTFKVMSVTTSKMHPAEGMYDVVLMESSSGTVQTAGDLG